MFQVIDTKTGKILGSYLTLTTAEIKRNAQCLLPADFMRFTIRFVEIKMPWEN